MNFDFHRKNFFGEIFRRRSKNPNFLRSIHLEDLHLSQDFEISEMEREKK